MVQELEHQCRRPWIQSSCPGHSFIVDSEMASAGETGGLPISECPIAQGLENFNENGEHPV